MIMLLLLLGGIDLGRLFYTQMAVTNAARIGTESLLDPRRCGDTDWVDATIRAEAAPFVSLTSINLPDTCTPLSTFTITTTARFTFTTPLMHHVVGGSNPRTVTGVHTARFRLP